MFMYNFNKEINTFSVIGRKSLKISIKRWRTKDLEQKTQGDTV